MSANGGLSGEEFLVLQEQLIALRNRNYELQEALQKKNNEIAQMASPKSEALQFASKKVPSSFQQALQLIHRRDKEKEVTQKYEAELDAMRKKLSSQEEEFRLQQETLISELNKVPHATPRARSRMAGTHNLAHETEAAHDTTAGDAATPVEQAEVHKVEDNAIVEALENKLLEYKERINQLDDSVKQLSSENAQLLSTIQEKEKKLISSSEFQKQTDMTSAKKDVFISHALQCISSIKVKLSQDQCCFPDQCLDIDLLDQEISSILGYISAGQAELCKVTEENAAFQQALSAARIEVETLTNKLSQTDETYKKEKAANNEVFIGYLRWSICSNPDCSVYRRLIVVLCKQPKNSRLPGAAREKVAALEKSGDKHIEDQILLLETRFQLELADREKAFESEREEMQLKLRSLEASLQAKDEEKTLSLKKQAAVIRELKRAAREEKKRAESMEKLGRCCSEERGWHLVGEADGKSAQLCSLFALIGVFVSRVKLWGDRLLQFSSGDVHVRFCHRSSLILCIVSRTYEQLDEQLNVLFDQIVSTLSRSQLDVVYKKKGDNYDLRRLLRGTDRLVVYPFLLSFKIRAVNSNIIRYEVR
ncbi:unnamed protein product [Heligmosomoides polygyrus]|uniref:Fuz_longin_1 domain-containing protein n=1 Tax=Heligmosomoides polygyrus TaxID=6339 RepID=A0A183GLV9_HELPZ|nr:unnamed protein product [Heligmosomoides polygyrus]